MTKVEQSSTSKEVPKHKFALEEKYKKITEMSLFRHLKKEVETGASGTQDYVIKKGPNKDKIAKT